jgi:hypothetical protein
MAAKKHKPKSLRPTDRPMSVISTAVGSLIHMTLTAIAVAAASLAHP